jgi:two-component system, cell cycle sensor histidine kinase and response regulator CckA
MAPQVCPLVPDNVIVLIAEDNPAQAEYLRSLLERNGFEVLAAQNGKEALDLARNQTPSVVVSAVTMPEMDGYALCRALKAEPDLKSIPTILVTELSSPHDVLEGLSAGADNFLVKPYEDTHVLSHISRLLASTRFKAPEQSSAGIEIERLGRHHLLAADPEQILNLLLSTHDYAMALGQRLGTKRDELARSSSALDALCSLATELNRCRTRLEVVRCAVSATMRIPGVGAAWLNLVAAGRFTIIDTDIASNNARCVDADCVDCGCQRLLMTALPASVFDIQRCERLADAGAHLGIPLFANGKPAGLLNSVSSEKHGSFSEHQRRILVAVAAQISDALERIQLRETLTSSVAAGTSGSAEDLPEDQREPNRILDAIEYMGDGFAVYDANGRLVTCNEKYRQMHPQTAHLIVPGSKFEDLLRAGLECGSALFRRPDDEQVKTRLESHRLAKGVPAIQQLAGSWVMVTERRTPKGDVIVIKTDVTELKQSSKAANGFLATLSHELRTPVTSMRNVLSFLTADNLNTSPSSGSELIEFAARNCSRLARTIDDLLDLARIDAGSFALNFRLTELQPILEQALESKEIVANIVNLRLNITDRAKGVRLLADPFRIQQVIDNLLLNAAIFSDGHAQIDLVADRRDDVVRVSIVEHGHGIPKALQDRIFKIFDQTIPLSIRQRGRSRLGLAIARAIVEAHQGRLSVSSIEGQGTTFYFELPLAVNRKLKMH